MKKLSFQEFILSVFLMILVFVPLLLYAQGKPNIISHDAQYLDGAVKITVRWQSPNPVLLVSIFAGSEQKDIKVDEYDNIRNRDGYTGEVGALIKLSSTPATDSISYVVQVQDDLRQKSEQVVGKIKVPVASSVLIAQQPAQGIIQQQAAPGIQIGIQQGLVIGGQAGVQPGVQPAQPQAGQPGDMIDKLLAVMDRHDTPPVLHDITVNRLGPDTVSFSSKAQDDKGLREVKFKILEATGAQAGEETLSNLGKIWQGTTKTFTLPAGNYRVVAQAFDTAGNTSPEKAANFQISGKAGSITVTITPKEAVTAGAQWRISGSSWQPSGATMPGVPVGAQTVEFKDVPGWGKPANINVTIEDSKVASAKGEYTRQFGSLQVTITPQAAIYAGAQWRVDGGEWQKIGALNIAIGNHVVDFRDIPGWPKPVTQPIAVQAGQATTVNGVYTVQAGRLAVTITPQAAIDAGAQWRVDGGAWQGSGVVLPNVPAGIRTIEFKDVSGWAKPQNQSATVQAGKDTTASGSYSRVYTSDKDFDEGTYVGLEHQTVRDQLQLSKSITTLPFIWIPNSNEGTISKIDTRTGDELGRYRVSPSNVYSDPSRTTVDLQGNCWVGNRQAGTIVKVGLSENGQCVDRNGNGKIDTSTGANNVLDWGQDECVLHEVVVIPGKEATYIPGKNPGSYSNYPYPRGVAIDANNNVWASTFNAKKFYYIDGKTGSILKTIDVSSSGHTSYGLVVDSFGILWSSGSGGNNVLRLDPKTGAFTKINTPHLVYGLGLDKANHLFAAGLNWGRLTRINTATGQIEWTKDIGKNPRSIAVTNDGDLWITNYQYGTVTRLSNDGVVKATISVGGEPSGVAVDANGKVWAVNYYDKITRIDPATNKVDLDKQIRGFHYSYSDMTGIIARSMTTRIGTWTVVVDSKSDGTKWQGITWNSSEPQGTSIKVRVRSSADQKNWANWEDVVKGGELKATPPGRYLQVETTLQILSGEVSPMLNDLTVLIK